MRRALPIIAATLLVAAAGLVHGRWTQRWAGSHAVEDAVARLGRVPMALGGWRGRDAAIDPRQLEVGEIAGYVSRRYLDRGGRAAVTMLLVCGRPGPISVHTPDVCYAGAGFAAAAPPAVRTLPLAPPGPAAEFRDAVLSKRGPAGPTSLRILWSWTSVGAWEVPDNPRLAFAPRPVLYKLYVIREMTAADERIDEDPSLDFLRVLLPELGRALFPNGGAAGRSAS